MKPCALKIWKTAIVILGTRLHAQLDQSHLSKQRSPCSDNDSDDEPHEQPWSVCLRHEATALQTIADPLQKLLAHNTRVVGHILALVCNLISKIANNRHCDIETIRLYVGYVSGPSIVLARSCNVYGWMAWYYHAARAPKPVNHDFWDEARMIEPCGKIVLLFV